MKNFIFALLIIFFIPLVADMKLEHLDQFEKQECLEILEKAELKELWDAMLTLQTAAFFPQESLFLQSQRCWVEADNILDMGSGNGVFLQKLSEKFPEKQFLGLEQKSEFVLQANKNSGSHKIHFIEGDAESFNEEYVGQFDVVLMRLVLQHMKQPRLAIKNAYKYLKENGSIIIIDAFDAARSASHVIGALEDAVRKHNEKNKLEGKGNRRITIELLNEVMNGPLKDQFKVAFTNLDEQGKVLSNVIKWQSIDEHRFHFNSILIYMMILHRSYGVQVDISQAYNELRSWLAKDDVWSCPGVHYLILQKNKSPFSPEPIGVR